MKEKSTPRQMGLRSQLVRLLDVIDASGQAILPFSGDELLNSIVEAAARIFRAAAASIILVDEHEQALVFRVTTGKSDRNLVGMRFPLDQGIAGYVVMTGQPLAISNVRQDARFNQDFAESTGYVPTSILAMPLKAGERVIGVMEVLDKIDAASFGMQDMELLGIFAQQAAIAISQSEHVSHMKELFLQSIRALAKKDKILSSADIQVLFKATSAGGRRRELMEMAALLNAISLLGEKERKLSLQVLKVFAEQRKGVKKGFYGR